MTTKYCTLSEAQKEHTVKYLHNAIYWLLLYKERKDANIDKYFDSLMFKLGGMNSLFDYPVHMVELLALLEGARIELSKDEDEFNFKVYRKAILDAESVVDKL